MPRRRWALLAVFVAWTAYIWVSRIVNAWGSSTESTGGKVFSTVLSGVLLALALGGVVVLVRTWKAPLTVGAAAMLLSSQSGFGQEEEEELPYDEAQLYFELNHTDGDLGFHGLADGDAWKSLEIEAPNETLLMSVWIRNNLRRQGMTEIFFESEEPTFDELPPAQFFNRFGVTLEIVVTPAQVVLRGRVAGPEL